MIKKTVGIMSVILVAASIALAANPSVNVDVSTPNVRVQVGTPQAPPPPQVRVIERERVIVKEKVYEEKGDRGKHKGHYKKHKKHKKHED